jgi:putative RNA 2'-phosphotransferase
MADSGGAVGASAARLTRLSKTVAVALRHRPWAFELEITPDGWVSVDGLLGALREEPRWRTITMRDLEAAVAHGPRRRYEIAGGCIRAYDGPAAPVAAPPVGEIPDLLFHGTTAQAVPAIREEGLHPRRRKFVHLGVELGIARVVGERRTATAVVLKVDAKAAQAAGVAFHWASREIVLADPIPPLFLDFGPV